MTQKLFEQLQQHFGDKLQQISVACDQITIEIAQNELQEMTYQLRDNKLFQFDTLIDLCAVDYSEYGVVDWETESTTNSGFSRGVEHDVKTDHEVTWDKPRFAVVYHVLSTILNQRLRVKVFCDEKSPIVDSLIDVWSSANWFEREAYDLYGILFNGHPDLRRILTDYGFIGHPFRKDFPLIGEVAMRYDAELERVIYEPVDIEPRTLVAKVSRCDNRYILDEEKKDA